MHQNYTRRPQPQSMSITSIHMSDDFKCARNHNVFCSDHRRLHGFHCNHTISFWMKKTRTRTRTRTDTAGGHELNSNWTAEPGKGPTLPAPPSLPLKEPLPSLAPWYTAHEPQYNCFWGLLGALSIHNSLPVLFLRPGKA